jgi:hypothetical protein
MRWFCEEAPLPEAARSWRTSQLLFILLFAPVALLEFAGAVESFAGAILQFQIGQAGAGALGILFLLCFVVPLIHVFVSIVRMKRAAGEFTQAEIPKAEQSGGLESGALL